MEVSQCIQGLGVPVHMGWWLIVTPEVTMYIYTWHKLTELYRAYSKLCECITRHATLTCWTEHLVDSHGSGDPVILRWSGGVAFIDSAAGGNRVHLYCLGRSTSALSSPPPECVPSVAQSQHQVPYQVVQNCHLSHFCHLTLVDQLVTVGRLVPALHLIHSLPLHLWVQVHRELHSYQVYQAVLEFLRKGPLSTDSPCCFSSEDQDGNWDQTK